MEKEDERDILDNRLLAIRANIALKRIYLNACIGGEWGRLVFSEKFSNYERILCIAKVLVIVNITKESFIGKAQ